MTAQGKPAENYQGPVILVHLRMDENPALAVCTGTPYRPVTGYEHTPRVLCVACQKLGLGVLRRA